MITKYHFSSFPGPTLIPYPIFITDSRVLKYRFDTHAIVAFLNVLNTALLRRTEVFSCFFLSIVALLTCVAINYLNEMIHYFYNFYITSLKRLHPVWDFTGKRQLALSSDDIYSPHNSSDTTFYLEVFFCTNCNTQ